MAKSEDEPKYLVLWLLTRGQPGSWELGVKPGFAIHLFYDLGQATSPLWVSVSSFVKLED